MPTNGEIIRQIDNVQAFIEAQTLHSRGLQRNGFIFRDSLPVWLRPYVEVSRGGFPHNRILREEYIYGVGQARALNEQDRAKFGERDIYGVELRKPVEMAGHSMMVTRSTLREWGAAERVAQMVTQPAEEWMKTSQHKAMDVATAGAFSDGSEDPTDGFTPTIDGFEGDSYTLDSSTEAADTASATIAHSSHLVQWEDRKGDKFSAGHDHIDPSVGGDWTRARGRAQVDLLKEHRGVERKPDCFVGSNVRDSILDSKEAWRGADASNVGQTDLLAQFIEGGGRDFGGVDFGVPEFLGVVDNGRYFFVEDLPADIQVTIANPGGMRPFRLHMGLQGENGTEAPYAWNNPLHPEFQGNGNEKAAYEVGYRGHWGMQVQIPYGVAVAKMVA